MPFKAADRVKETTTTTGTGTYSLAGAVTGFQTFVAGIGTGNLCDYVVEDGTNWEVGVGTVTDATPDTLARTVVLASSNAGAAVNWGAGTKTVFNAQTAINKFPRTKRLLSRVLNSTTTGVKLTDLDIANLTPGAYHFQFLLIVQSAATSTGLKFGVNFTGSIGNFGVFMKYSDTGTSATSGVAGVTVGILETIHGSFAVNALSTTAPNLGPLTGVLAANTDYLIKVDGAIEVTATGTLEIYHGSEVAAQSSVELGSGVIVTRMDIT